MDILNTEMTLEEKMMRIEEIMESEEYKELHGRMHEAQIREKLTEAMRLTDKVLEKKYHPDLYGLLADLRVTLFTRYEGTQQQVINSLKDKTDKMYGKAVALEGIDERMQEVSHIIKRAFFDEPVGYDVVNMLTLLQNRG